MVLTVARWTLILRARSAREAGPLSSRDWRTLARLAVPTSEEESSPPTDDDGAAREPW